MMTAREFRFARWSWLLPLAIAVLAFSAPPAPAQALTPLVFPQVEGKIREKYKLLDFPDVRWADIEGELPLSGTFLISGAVDIQVGTVTVETKPFYAIVQLFFGLGASVTSVQVGGLELPPDTSSAPPGSVAQFSARPAAVPSDASGSATCASADGSTIVGYIDNGHFTPFHAFHWTEAAGIVDLGTLDPANNTTRSSYAHDVSNDGAVVVGFSDTAAGTTQHVFRWTQTGGMLDLGTGAGTGTEFSSRAYGVSGDGSVIIGESAFPNGSGGLVTHGFRWTSAGGFQSLGALQPGRSSIANAVTTDGAVVVGMSSLSVTIGNTTTGGLHAFRWTQSDGMQDLGALPGHRYSAATAVSDDGSIVVGISSLNPIDRFGTGAALRYDNTAANSRAFYWTATEGVRDLTQLLADAGIDMTGTTIVACTSISADGVWMSGEAITPTTPVNETTGVFFSLTDTPPPETSRLLNLSTRALCQSGDNVLIPGFVISGTANKKLLIRAVGPTLGKHPFNLAGTLANPRMTLKKFNTAVTPNRYDDIANNDDWATNTNAAVIAQMAEDLFAFAFNDDREAALLMDLAPGQYTVVADDVSAGTGIAIVELYDGDAASVDSRLINISNRGFCGTGDQVMIPGFVVSSESPRTVLIRVVGPTLSGDPFKVLGTITDPKLELHRTESDGSDTLVATQDNWSEHPNAATTAQIAQQVQAFPLVNGSKDAAFVATLTPGSYTVVGSSAVANGTGVVLVEVYVVP